MNIIVNATALKASGALTILKQFLKHIPVHQDKYIVFVHDSLKLEINNNNVQLIYIKEMSFIRRFLWDFSGVKYWLKKNGIIPSVSISLQNTNFNTGYKVPNFVYYHQPIPFFNNNWNPLKKQERLLWFYKSIYPFFVSVFMKKNTEIFVQLNTVKDAFSKKYNISLNRIHVVRPDINLPNKLGVIPLNLDKDKVNLFYPATPYVYKNHNILFDAILKLSKDKQSKICLYITCLKEDLLYENIEELKDINIIFMGSIPFLKVISMYTAVNAVVFPSYIETFGLPLIEAASLSCPILAADIPYANEVLANYNGVKFLPFNNSDKWADEISKINVGLNKEKNIFKEVEYQSWNDLFKIIKNYKNA